MTQKTDRRPCELYLITPAKIEDGGLFCRQLDAVLKAGPIAALQIRLKDISEYELIALAKQIIPVAHENGVAVIMNDLPKLAKSLKCDGVHLGQDDMGLKEARALLGADAMIGVTCHNSRHLAMEAAENGADYVAFGAFFETSTKDVVHKADLETLSIWQETMQIPCVAIGGIQIDNVGSIVKAGADFVAVSSAVWAHQEGPVKGVTALLDAMAQA